MSMGFPRQEYWNGLPFPSPGDLPNPGIKPVSCALPGGFFTTQPPGKPSLARSTLIVVPEGVWEASVQPTESLVKRETEAHTLIFFLNLSKH